ncbi:MAG: sigma-70 family RNA polymerase sigma factor [Actinomycetota bacterium]
MVRSGRVSAIDGGRLDGRRTGGTAAGARPRPGDEQWFAANYRDLRRFAAVVADSDVDPDDLVQEALVGVLRRGGFDGLDNPGAYLRRSIVNLGSNERRRLGRKRRTMQRLRPLETAVTESYPSDLADLERLPSLDRAILHLTLVDGLAAEEVGAMVGLSVNAVHLRLSRSRRRLRRAVEHEQRADNDDRRTRAP